MCAINKLDLDELQEEFEQAWTRDACGIDRIKQFLSSRCNDCEHGSQAGQELLQALVEIDLERWWMDWGQLVTEIDEAHEPNGAIRLQQRLATRPLLSDYLALFAQPVDPHERLWTLAMLERQARNCYGDQVGRTHYWNQWKLRLPPAGSQLPDQGIYLQCQFDTEPTHQRKEIHRLRGLSVLGRQRSHETAESHSDCLSERKRIVIAKRHETMISREHLTIQVVATQHVIITNISRVNAVSCGQGPVLVPQESRLLKLPLTLLLPGRQMFLYSASAEESGL